MVTPFSLTPDWVGAWLRGATPPAVEGKALAHCRLSTGRLTVPVEGGASVLKRRGADPVLSEHGKWRREHLGAWNAAYGRTPFFPYLMPQIEEVYRRSEGMTLGEFTAALLDVAVSWIEPEVLRADGEMIQAVRTETDVKVDRSLSIFDAIFRLGKESAFAL